MNAAPIRVVTAAWPSPTEPRRARFLEDLHRELEGPFRTEVVAPLVRHDDPAEELRAGIPVTRFPYPSGDAPVRAHGISPLAALTYLVSMHGTAIDRWARSDGDRGGVVLAHWLVPGGLVAAHVARRLRVPLVLYAHGSDLHRYGRGRFARWLMRRMIPRAAAVLVASEELAERVRVLVDDPPPVHVVPVGIHPAFVAAPDPPPPPPPLRVLFVGDALASKGASLVARAIGCAQAEGLPVELEWIGTPADAVPRTDRGPVGRGRGDLDSAEVARAMARAHLLLLPSEAEGTPLVLQEAFAMRLPWAATPVGGIPALAEGRTGATLLPPPDAPDRVVDAIVDLLRRLLSEGPGDSRSRWEAMAGNEVASLSVSHRARQVGDVLEEVLRWAS